MAYKGLENFSHSQLDKVGVLLVNLGTPEAPTPKALRKYLAEFLSDPRVVEIPRLLWMIILHGIILLTRPKKSAHAYRQVWGKEGSPLMVHTVSQCRALDQRLHARMGDNVLVDYAMRYGSPSIPEKLDALLDAGARKLVVLPLYPQYSGSTTGSVFDAIAKDFSGRRWVPHLRFINGYHDFEGYVDALAKSVREHWDQHGKADKLMLSFHGVPQFFLHKGDPYHCQCLVTSRMLRDKLELSEDEVVTSFQSRFGKAEWLKPYTDKTLVSLAESGLKSVQVICPGFSADCLETLEEIAQENREYFLEAGGERFEYIAALNDSAAHIDVIEKLVLNEAGDWLSIPVDKVENTDNHNDRELRYQAHAFNKKI